jgi:hypothetical protein
MMMSKCSILSRNDNFCYPQEAIDKFIEKYIGNVYGDKGKLVDDYMLKRYNCEDITCWAKHSSIFKRYEGTVLLPKHRWDKKGWLSNHDVNNVFVQYEKYYSPDFKYLLDWDIDVLVRNKEKGRLTKLINDSKNVKYRAILLSLWGSSKEYHYFRHWTCIFLDGVNKRVFFFDSNGDIRTRWYVADLIEYISGLTGYNKYSYNNVMVQYDYEHCGLFCVHFVTYMLVTKGGLMRVFIDNLLAKLAELGYDGYYKYIKSLRWKYYR